MTIGNILLCFVVLNIFNPQAKTDVTSPYIQMSIVLSRERRDKAALFTESVTFVCWNN